MLPHSHPALAGLPRPPSRLARAAPTSCTRTHTAWPGVLGPLEHPVSRPKRPLLCGLPVLLLTALCPLTPPVPTHSLSSRRSRCPHPAWSISPLLSAPVIQQDRSPGTAGHTAPGCSFPSMASELPCVSWAAASPHSPMPSPSWADQSLSPSAAARGQGPNTPPVHRPPGVLVLNRHLQGVSPPPPTCTELLQAPGDAPRVHIPSGHL